MTSAERVAVLGTGLIGTSIAMAGTRAGDQVRGFDTTASVLAAAAERSGLVPSETLEECVRGATLVFVCTPIPAVAEVVIEALQRAPDAIVTDVGSVKSHVLLEVEAKGRAEDLGRYVGGHPMGGSERSGPDHASPSVLDGIVWSWLRGRAPTRPRPSASKPGRRRSGPARCGWMPNVTTDSSRW